MNSPMSRENLERLFAGTHDAEVVVSLKTKLVASEIGSASELKRRKEMECRKAIALLMMRLSDGREFVVYHVAKM